MAKPKTVSVELPLPGKGEFFKNAGLILPIGLGIEIPLGEVRVSDATARSIFAVQLLDNYTQKSKDE